MKRLAAAALLALALHTSALAGEAPKPDCAARPTWCAPGFVCVPTTCAAEASAQLELLAANVEALRHKRARKWTCTIGPGAGVYLQASGGAIGFDAAPIVGAVVCGWTL